MQVQQLGAVSVIRDDGLAMGWTQEILFISDAHFDSVKCNRDLLIEHLQEAVRRNAWIISVGDFFDAMQGRFDPRRSMTELRPEYRRDDYYDFVVKDATQFLAPYKDNLIVFADGNHELAVLKNANTNLADRLVSNLRAAGSPVVHGGFGGWVVLLMSQSGSGYKSIRIKYFHGSGGEAPVTRGAIQTSRQAVYLPDADIVVNGHSHNSYIIPISRERITIAGKQYFDLAYHIRTPGYKQDYSDGSGGWEVTRGGVPKPIGAIWCKLSFLAGRSESMARDGRVAMSFAQDIRGPEVVSPCGDVYDGPVWGEDERQN
jgi:UDP-2,3-diacylglucosamine pyrophosphatase LpxH